MLDPITEPKITSAMIGGEMNEKHSNKEAVLGPKVEVAHATDIRNPWVCQRCGAIMGSVYHEKIRPGLTISALILFRGAAMITETLPVNFIFGKVYAGEFGCSRCGEIRKWVPTPETLSYMAEDHKHHARRINRNL